LENTGARQSAIEDCQTNGVKQIGNALDWGEKYPDVLLRGDPFDSVGADRNNLD
jgi:hypothetical protein